MFRREAGLAKREEMFQKEVKDYEGKLAAAHEEKLQTAAELKELSEKTAAFEAREAT